MAARTKKTPARKSTAKKAPVKNSRAKAPKVTKKKSTTKKQVEKSTIIESPSKSAPIAKKSNKKLYLGIAVLGLLGLLAYLLRSYFIVSTVNGRPIYRHQVVKRLERLGGQQVVDELVQRELVMQEASRLGITVTDQELQDEIKTIEESFSGQGVTLDEVLTSQGVDRQEFEESIKLQIMMRKIIQDEIQVTDEEIQTYFDENKETFETENLDEVRDQIRQEIQDRKMSERLGTWLNELRQNATVEYWVDYTQ